MRILIVGGGPAGLALALALAHTHDDWQIDVFEKRSWPMDKVCGEGIMESGVHFLRNFGVLNLIPSHLQHPFDGISYINDNGRKIAGKFRSPAGLGMGIPRVELIKALVQACQQFPHIQLHSHREFVGLQQSLQDSTVQAQFRPVEDSSTHSHLSFVGDYLVACDGLNSSVRHHLAIPTLPLTSLRRMGARQHFAMAPWSKQVEVYWQKGKEAYVTPVGDQLVQVSFMWRVSPHKSSPSLTQLENELWSSFPLLRSKITGPATTPLKIMGIKGLKARTPVQGRVILLGDAYLFFDGITGEGMSLAFTQAQLLAQQLSKIKNNRGDFPTHHYLAGVNPITQRYILWTKLALFLVRFPLLRHYLFRFLPAPCFTTMLQHYSRR